MIVINTQHRSKGSPLDINQDIDKELAALPRNSNVQIGDLGENDRNLALSPSLRLLRFWTHTDWCLPEGESPTVKKEKVAIYYCF
ncbi:hypothetical protein CDAR_509651 [Caerostris darwini]|uniref:Uncharacterized protein n=1 Tax=Caerostris darwini TaxID=1538125 RepID=A0AAV4P1P9_9ARAC|nr:hypothetical protein CDAR_509651 [Caerostris darwini]